MWLQDQIFEFKSLSDEKLNVKEIASSTLVSNELPTKTTLEFLFKGKPSPKSGNRLKGFSILQYVNEKGEIEINSKIYKVSFINEGTPFILKGYKNSQVQRRDKKLSPEDISLFGNLISGTTTGEEAKVAATAESTPSKAEDSASSPVVKAEDGAVVKEKKAFEFVPFNPAKYSEDKAELIADGYKEYKSNEPSNYSILTKGEDVKLVELLKDDYNVLDVDEYNIELDEASHTFKIEKISELIK